MKVYKDAMAVSATLHCLTGCAIGEILGLMIGAALGLSVLVTIILAVSLAFAFGYALSLLPLVQGGIGLIAAFKIAFVADTLSITTMEIVDNAAMLTIPGAMAAGLASPLFWVSMSFALFLAFLAAVPVNSYLISRGKGHCHAHAGHTQGAASVAHH